MRLQGFGGITIGVATGMGAMDREQDTMTAGATTGAGNVSLVKAAIGTVKLAKPGAAIATMTGA